jgi:hypothetical protein
MQARPAVGSGRISLQIRIVAGYWELVHRKEQMIAEAGFEPPTVNS